jgi:hypothetical protein
MRHYCQNNSEMSSDRHVNKFADNRVRELYNQYLDMRFATPLSVI